MAAPSKELLDSMAEKASPKPAATVTVEIETPPDFEALGEAFRSALKGNDNEALCKAVAAIAECCGVEDTEIEED